VEAQLHFYSSFFSHSIKLYVAYRYQHSHSITALPAKMFVFNSHMLGFHSVISNKPRFAHQKNIFVQIFFCSANINIWTTFLLLKTSFISLVTYSVGYISH